MLRIRWKGEKVSGKTEDNVIEALESFAETRPRSPHISWFKVQRQPKRNVIEEAEKRNKYLFLEDVYVDVHVIDLHVWEGINKMQILFLLSGYDRVWNSVNLVLWQPGI